MRLCLLGLLTFAACGGPAASRQIEIEGIRGTVHVEQPPPPPPPPPAPKPAPIWGVNTVADVNPDPNTVEFNLTAEEKTITLTSRSPPTSAAGSAGASSTPPTRARCSCRSRALRFG